MPNPKEVKIDEKTIKVIENVLAKDDRVELIPTKDGIKVIKVIREAVKFKEETK